MVRDYSQKTVQELYETIRVNVDEEEQWKVFDFVEDFFMEELEIGDYINDINSYHLHMFDKHDVTTKKFDAIAEKAGKVDANYAAQIEGYCSLLGEYGKKFEAVCAMFALDLIGVKVFRYSDETAEAVKSGEKLLKESGTIYESFADMMSPEDAKRYLDFLENGSREGLTGAELAGVEKADALLVSRKVGYEDVWDLRNAGDVLETSYGKSREIIQCNTKDAAADELAKRIGGQSRSAFADDPIQREFDVISDQYIAQAKPPLKCVNKTVRTQMKATFEAAKKYERKVYYQFEGIPSQEVLDKLYEHSERYGVEVIIDTEPLGILN
jgi:hypothetical protein